MRDRLAEQLLAVVMEWDPSDVARERPLLQAMASLKYDEYQQFSPGMRFVESLACWLEQFRELDERRTAYQFVKTQLLFYSTAEINHLVAIAYPHHIRPLLLNRAAREAGQNPWHVGKTAHTVEFRSLERQTLFLGLSDGARTDVFRRNNPQLGHEQIRLSHELATERVEKLLQKLHEDIMKIQDTQPPLETCRFRTIVLLDDFSGSGFSYLRLDEQGRPDGKVADFVNSLFQPDSSNSRLIDLDDLEIVVVLYLATADAQSHLSAELQRLCSDKAVHARVLVVHLLPSETKIVAGQDPKLDAILERYYDESNETSSTRLGGTDLRYGFAACGLPLILSHNTPNNSLGILWAKGPRRRPLFPRVTRHKDRV